MTRASVLALLVLACHAAAVPADRPQSASSVGPTLKIAPFSLTDFQGRRHELSDYDNKKIVVLAFLGAQCPLAQRYARRLAQLHDKYASRGVQFLGIDSNRQDGTSEIATFARQTGITFPILKDLNNEVADQLHATRTPEVVVVDRQRTVRYRGRIDDQYGVGYAKNRVTHAWLDTALGQLLSGQSVERPETEPIGCLIGRVRRADPTSTVTYCRQIARILNKRCVACHRAGEIAPFAMTGYRAAAGWAEPIAEAVRDGRMPPWFADPKYGAFANDCRLSQEEKQAFFQWAAAGAPEGDPKELPPAPAFVDGWQLPRKPDRIIDITPQPVAVPAAGIIPYQYYTVDPGFKEDKWIRALEVRPGNRAVVHHVMVIALPKKRPGGGGRRRPGGEQALISFVPGGLPLILPPGWAKLFPAGYELQFEVHYTANGSPQTDRSKLGLIFADPKDVTHRVQTLNASNKDFEIPPGEPDFVVEADSPALPSRSGIELTQFYPHMHLRGKSFRYVARYPGGRSEILLDVPHYDFSWQLSYYLARPKPLPTGTSLHCIAHFDNSEHNLNNPDPTAVVREGNQTWQEMMVGYFDVVFPVLKRQTRPGRPAQADSHRGIRPIVPPRIDEHVGAADQAQHRTSPRHAPASHAGPRTEVDPISRTRPRWHYLLWPAAGGSILAGSKVLRACRARSREARCAAK